MVSTRTESISAVDASAAQRFGWVTDAARSPPTPDAIARAPRSGAAFASLWPTFRAEEQLVGSRGSSGSEVTRAAGWLDSLPVKLDAQDGGMLITMRLRGP